MNNRYVLIRGLVRGNGHWGNFIDVLKSKDPGCEIELCEIPGNGTRSNEITPTDPLIIVSDFRKRSLFCHAKKPFILLGLSLGGMLALKWLEQFPEDVQKTYIVNSSIHALSPFYRRFNYKNYFDVAKIILTSTIKNREHQILKLTSNRNDLDTNLVQQIVNFSIMYQTSRLNFLRQLVLASKIEIKNSLRQPIRIIQSEKDRLVDPECSLKLSFFLNSPLVTHPTSGHDIPLDDPKWLAEVVMEA